MIFVIFASLWWLAVARFGKLLKSSSTLKSISLPLSFWAMLQSFSVNFRSLTTHNSPKSISWVLHTCLLSKARLLALFNINQKLCFLGTESASRTDFSVAVCILEALLTMITDCSTRIQFACISMRPDHMLSTNSLNWHKHSNSRIGYITFNYVSRAAEFRVYSLEYKVCSKYRPPHVTRKIILLLSTRCRAIQYFHHHHHNHHRHDRHNIRALMNENLLFL